MVLKLEEAQYTVLHSWWDKFQIDRELNTGARQIKIKISFLLMMKLLERVSMRAKWVHLLTSAPTQTVNQKINLGLQQTLLLISLTGTGAQERGKEILLTEDI